MDEEDQGQELRCRWSRGTEGLQARIKFLREDAVEIALGIILFQTADLQHM